MRSKKLLRQIKKSLTTESFEAELQDLVEQLKKSGTIENAELWVDRLSEFKHFLDTIDNSYSQNETMLELANRSLEVSTKELFEANEKFRLINRAITAMMNSLDEGFLVIDRQGICGQVVSLAAKNFLGREPVGEPLGTILNVSPEDRSTFDEWLRMVFDEVIPFEDLIELAPKVLKGGDTSEKIEIKFKPIRNNEDGKILEIVVILIDVSERVEAERKLGEQKLFTDMVIKYLNNKPNFMRMVQMTQETSDSMKSWLFNQNEWLAQIDALVRDLHTLKGGLNTLSMYSLGYKVHQTEDELLAFCKGNTSMQECENLIHFLGQELRESLEEFLQKNRRIFAFDNRAMVIKEVPTNNIYKFCSELSKMGLSDLLKYYVDEIVAVPLASLFAPIEANIYSQSLVLDKSVVFTIVDPLNIRVVPEYYSPLFEQLVHVFNNIIDHGLETSEERQALQKDVCSKVVVKLELVSNAQGQEQALVISLSDDGRGIDPLQIRKKLLLKGVESSKETDAEVIGHIFDHGFSTRDSASLTSGRGVGMASVHKVIREMGGNITVTSHVGSGTTFTLTVPYVKEFDSRMTNWFTDSGQAGPGGQTAAS
jgi:two-component system chemotaxis sensor kinase CheA